MDRNTALVIWLDRNGHARAARTFCGWLYNHQDGHEIGVSPWAKKGETFEGKAAIEEAERFTATLSTAAKI